VERRSIEAWNGAVGGEGHGNLNDEKRYDRV
jgi:hypothetical protein